MERLSVLLADDHRLFAEACMKMLEPEYDVVGIVRDGRALLQTAPALRPDVIVLDIAMPLLNGLDAARQLRKIMPSVKLVFMTMHQDSDLLDAALSIGALGYILKTSASCELVEAIRAAAQGKTFIAAQIRSQMDRSFVQHGRGKRHRTLTHRQREVLQLLAEGYSMKKAGEIAHVAPRTIAFHKYRIMEQFNIGNNAELFQFAIREGIIVDGRKEPNFPAA